jgi:hypothetical protein
VGAELRALFDADKVTHEEPAGAVVKPEAAAVMVLIVAALEAPVVLVTIFSSATRETR